MNTKKILAAGAAAAVMAAGGAGAIPALAAGASKTGLAPVGSVFSGRIEIASTSGLLVERRNKKGSPILINVDTDAETVVSKGGQARSLEDLAQGAEVIVSGIKEADGSILASKIIIRG